MDLVTPAVVQAILLVLLGGLFGWTLSQQDDKVVMAVAGVAIVLAVIVIIGAV